MPRISTSAGGGLTAGFLSMRGTLNDFYRRVNEKNRTWRAEKGPVLHRAFCSVYQTDYLGGLFFLGFRLGAGAQWSLPRWGPEARTAGCVEQGNGGRRMSGTAIQATDTPSRAPL